MILLLAAHAADLQIAVFPPGLALADTLIAGQVFRLRESKVGAAVSCFDEVGVRNLNLTVPLDGVSIIPQAGYASVRVDFGTISAEDWTLYAEDSERDNDLCDPFHGELLWLALTDGALSLDTALSIDDERLQMDVVGDPVLSGDLGMDIEWAPEWAEGWGWDLWPDDLILDLFEEELLAIAAQAIANMASDMVSDLLGDLSFTGEVGQLGLAVGLQGLAISPEGVELRATPSLSWAAEDACIPEARSAPGGADSSVVLRNEGSAAGVAISERLLNELGWQLWSDGLFCMQADGVEAYVDLLLPELGATALSGSFSLAEPPRFSLAPDGLSVGLTGLAVRIDGWDDGPTTVIDGVFDLEARVLVGVDPVLNMVVVQDLALAIDITELRSQHLFSDAEGAEEEFISFVERWAPTLVSDALVGLQVAPAVIEVMGFVARIDRIEAGDGALSAYVSAWPSGDSTLDVLPPETTATLADSSLTTATLSITASDDRSGELAWKWRLRGEEEWSAWTTAASIEVPLPVTGKTEVQVVARDAWFNEDSSPAAVRLVPTLGVTSSGCGVVPGPTWVGLLALLWMRRAPSARRGGQSPA